MCLSQTHPELPTRVRKALGCINDLVKSSHLYLTLYTIMIVSKQFYSVKQESSLSIMQEDNNKESFFQLKSDH